MLVALAREAIARDANALTLEVRLSHRGAQRLYQRFGFTAVGVRKGYYADSGEDALIMWAHDVDQPDYAALLDRLERGVPGTTVFERPRAGDGAHPRHRDLVRRDRGRGRRRRPDRALVGRRRARSTSTRATAASCPRSRAAPTSSSSTT